ncbi:hypothetical protein VCHA53O466_50028 [Vibrio chagasii]|nr:hypothetical protein VCHA53O466_50028 [Vibrio chagasii]
MLVSTFTRINEKFIELEENSSEYALEYIWCSFTFVALLVSSYMYYDSMRPDSVFFACVATAALRKLINISRN